ncbi:ubiquitin thioesterase ZRANB1 isoform X2 [Echinops telfairi]|uniref:Ubiquitin thioesterase ZRANB1 isoform X2 n=1 Tax=Echinops telfairi TaxID=9371 RepID=A0AC55D5Z3_ECHTE|nr:ubiquitin thioesterase ZRANB1 isoform X2 [Echinops telfairi]
MCGAPEIVPAASKSTLTPQHKPCCAVTASIELQGSVELAQVGSGVVEGDLAAVEAYKSSGGDIARQLTADEVRLLNRPSAFDGGYTLVHLAIRFQRQDMLAILLTEVSQQAAKCIPAMVCPELTEQVRREIAASLHQRKGDFACYFLTDLVTFTLPADIEDLPPTVQEKLFDEVLDRDVQKELEEESPIINWSLELATRLDSRLYALWNRTAGDCLLDSVLQATWGIYDKDSVLRKALHDSLHDCSHWFYTRWKDWESWYSQSFGLHFSLREEQWQEDWAFILSLASQPGASLEQTHIFVLAHILRRPIIVYGVKYYKSFRGETLGYTRFQGVYLPLLWEQSFCWKSPIALGYTRGHFSALVAMENDGYGSRGAGANLNTDDDITITFLPLVDSERKLLHVHFLSAQELGNEEQREKLLRQWLDCCVTEGGVLVAMQKGSRRRSHPLVTQMVEKWLDRYRQIRPCTSLSDGEEDEDDEDE